MKKRITFKMFFSVLGRGLWQGVCWVGGLFGLKDSSSCGKAAKRIIMGSLAVISLILAVTLSLEATDELYDMWQRHVSSDSRGQRERQLGDDYTYVHYYTGEKSGYVRDNKSGKKVLEGIVWLIEPQDGDSLVVYKTTKNKRGYFNRYSGKVQIAPRFDKAWIFSSGLASVMEQGEIYFIDHNGNRAFDKTFAYPWKDDGYCFHGQHCAVESKDGKTGLIDKNGEWAVEPVYDFIRPGQKNLWELENGDLTGVMTDSLSVVLPVQYTNVRVYSDGIYATCDGVRKLYDLDGNVKVDFVVGDVGRLYYPTDKCDDSGERVYTEAQCMWYNTDYWHYGLMDTNGKPITKAVYHEVDAITANRYKCDLGDDEYVILDQYGNVVN